MDDIELSEIGIEIYENENETITTLFVINFILIHLNQIDFPSIKINFARLLLA